MKSLNNKLELLTNHLKALSSTFDNHENYSEQEDYLWYKVNNDRFEYLATDTSLKYSNLKISSTSKSKKVNLSFADEIYHEYDRQMKLADIIEYIFISRGIYFIFQSNQFKQDRISIFLELILRFVNLLMAFENVTVDTKLRTAYLNELYELIKDDEGYKELKEWTKPVGLPTQDKNAPSEYFDTLLPKTAGGLWHELLVYSFILKYNIGYIFPLLLSQKPISLTGKLSPPDLIILHNKTYRYYGIEIGNLKERQSGGFMAPSGIPVIPIDTLNARISDRCPSCKKWIGICAKTIEDFCDISGNNLEPKNEIRCLVDCTKYTLEEKVDGKCPVMKFRTNSKIGNKLYEFSDGKHYHYKYCTNSNKSLIDSIKSHSSYEDLLKLNDIIQKNVLSEEDKRWKSDNYNRLRRKFNFIKTHSIYYSELTSLIKINNTEHDAG